AFLGQETGARGRVDGLAARPAEGESHRLDAAFLARALEHELRHRAVALEQQRRKARADQRLGFGADEGARRAGGKADLALGRELEEKIGGGEREADEAVALVAHPAG